MKASLLSASVACLITTQLLSAAAEKHYLYISSPDGAQSEGRSGTGILIFDMDAGHQFVRRINIHSFQEGLRGFTGNAKTHRIYYSTTSRRLGCFDLESDQIVWERSLPAGCDRSSVTTDGKKVYVPSGWWYAGADSGLLVVDAETGDLQKRIPVGRQAHNSITSLDGRFVYLGTETNLTVLSTSDDRILHRFPGVGEFGVFPFTVDSQNRRAYVCLGQHIGFDMVDLSSGAILHRVQVGTPPIPHRTHGAALTPDERELWISDQVGKKLFYFDATQTPPQLKGHIDISMGGHGWVAFSLDGKYAWCHTPDVIDAHTKKVVATLKDEHGTPVCSSKFIEVHFQDAKVVRMGNEFGLGRAHLDGRSEHVQR